MARSWLALAAIVAMGCLGGTRDAAAQGRASSGRAGGPRPPRFEVSGGAGWTGSSDLGSTSAQLTGNGVPTGPPVTLFETGTQVESGPRFDGRVAWRWTRILAIEGGVSITRTHVRTDVRNDFEQAPGSSATERFTEYAFEGGVLVDVPKLTFGSGRVRPFVTGGGGYLRQMHEGAIVIEEGGLAFAGGGARYTLHEARRRAFIKAFGLRGDVRLNVKRGGLEIDRHRRTHVGPSTTASLFLRF